MAPDALIAEGGQITELAPETVKALNRILPKHWRHQNPIDIIGDAEPNRYAIAMEIAARDPNSDGFPGNPEPAGNDESDRGRRALGALRQARRQARARELDGRRLGRCRRTLSQQCWHAHVPVSRHCSARVPQHVAVQFQPPQPV
jgi:hypothetical protein